MEHALRADRPFWTAKTRAGEVGCSLSDHPRLDEVLPSRCAGARAIARPLVMAREHMPRLATGRLKLVDDAGAVEGLGLAEAIGALRDELLRARAEGAGSAVQLPIESMTVE